MRNALATQFLPDGVHVERSPSYASWMTRVGVNYARLARLFPKADARVDAERVARALDYHVQSSLCGFNDSRCLHADPPELSELKARLDGLAALFPRRRARRTPPLEQVFPDAGQVFMRTSWKPGAEYVAFDASSWGGAHMHLSRLALVYRAKGRLLVADPGILDYEMSNPFASYGKSTRAHSTLNVNGWNQSGADPTLLRTEFTRDVSLVRAKYEGGYWEGEFGWGFNEGRKRGVFGAHERIVLWVKGEYLLALDAMEADAGAEIRNVWQMGPMESWACDADELEAWSANAGANVLVKLMMRPANAEMQYFEGSRDPMRGWVGRQGNDHVPAPLVEFRYPAAKGDAVRSAVLIAAFEGDARPRCEVKSARSTERGFLNFLELALPAGGTDWVAWSKDLEPPIDDGKPFVTDAPFVWLRLDAKGKPRKCFVLDGSYLEYDGRKLFEKRKRKTRVWGA
jgi:hypothetical protein